MLCPREKIFGFRDVFKKLWTFEKNQQAIFGKLLTDVFFFSAPVCFRLNWVKTGEITENFFLIFFFVFLTHDDSEFLSENSTHYECC